MQIKFFKLSYLLTIAILILSACNRPQGNAAPETLNTQAPISTNTPKPSDTPTPIIPTATPTNTPTETPQPSPTASFTPVVITAKVNRESNCRIGPGNAYDLVATYQADQLLEVVARDLGNGYVFVKNVDKPEEQCYLLAQNLTISGDVAGLPQFTPQPSPTAAPYFEASLRKIDTCNGLEFAIFNVENVGSIAFRSAYIRVKDLKNGKSVEQALNAFDLRVKCVLAKNIAPLNPGETGYVAAPPFDWSVGGDKLSAVLQLCTEKDLKGTCITRTFEVKP